MVGNNTKQHLPKSSFSDSLAGYLIQTKSLVNFDLCLENIHQNQLIAALKTMQATNWALGHWCQQLGTWALVAATGQWWQPGKVPPTKVGSPPSAKAAQYQKLPPNIKSSSIIGAITITTATIKYIQC